MGFGDVSGWSGNPAKRLGVGGFGLMHRILVHLRLRVWSWDMSIEERCTLSVQVPAQGLPPWYLWGLSGLGVSEN